MRGQGQSIKPYAVLLLGVTSVSFAAIFIRLAEAPSLIIAAYRLSIASMILVPTALWDKRQELGSLCRSDLGLALLSGFFLALHFGFWITSLEFTTVASSVIFVSTYPLMVGLISHFFTREKVAVPMFLGIVVAVVGGMIIGFDDIQLAGQALWGDWLAFLGAVTAAGYFLIGRRLRAKLSLISYISVVYLTAAVLLVIMALGAGHSFTGYGPRTYAMFLLLAVVPQILGHSSFNWALRYLSATFVTVTILGEPIGSTILAYFILKEVPTLLKMVGGGLILAGIYIASGEERKSLTEPVPAEI